MTSIGPQVDLITLLIGVSILVGLVVGFGYKRGINGTRYWALAALEVTIFFILWQLLWVLLRFLTYTGGSIELIVFRWNVSNLMAYLITIVLLLSLETRRDSSKLVSQLKGALNT